jgi:hypothetical protein
MNTPFRLQKMLFEIQNDDFYLLVGATCHSVGEPTLYVRRVIMATSNARSDAALGSASGSGSGSDDGTVMPTPAKSRRNIDTAWLGDICFVVAGNRQSCRRQSQWRDRPHPMRPGDYLLTRR